MTHNITPKMAMGYVHQKPICVSIPGMNIYLTTYFFSGIQDRPPRKHTHPCYEIVCRKLNGKVIFNVNPPLVEHYSKTVADGLVGSILFTFTEDGTDDICQFIRSVQQETEIEDTFDGLTRLLSVKDALERNDFGLEEQLKAEFRLFFVRLAQFFYMEDKAAHPHTQTLDEERIALLEDFFNIEMRFPNCNKQQLAAKIGVCERQLTRILKETYNSSFSAILLESRMNMAQAMLMHGEKSLAEIAESVGYTSVGAFRSAYNKFFGHPPVKNQDIVG
ncbi:MAG: helix-turn-helix transcriptional regulator [Clostridia bacterium]|nr:helix-turn-helix transcriptional regulator [Clostridia bacterium]